MGLEKVTSASSTEHPAFKGNKNVIISRYVITGGFTVAISVFLSCSMETNLPSINAFIKRNKQTNKKNPIQFLRISVFTLQQSQRACYVRIDVNCPRFNQLV